jgi:hypothetical protein
MDQNTKPQGQQGHDQQGHGQQGQTQSPTRDQAEGSRPKSRSNMGGQERGGISNRGMSSDEEQLDLPRRGSRNDDSKDQSER